MVQEKAEIKPKKWHQKWWGVILLIIFALFFVTLAAFIYEFVFLVDVQKQALLMQNNLNKTLPGSVINIRDIAERGSGSYLGPQQADLVLVEFADFQCPYCKAVFLTIKALGKEYGNSLKIIFRNYPNTIDHPQALKAALAAACANEQNKFWEYHDQLFINQADLSDQNLKNIALNLGLNSTQFNQCLDSNKYLVQIQSDMQDGATLNVKATPTFLLNGNSFSGNVPYDVFKKIIDQAKIQVSNQ